MVSKNSIVLILLYFAQFVNINYLSSYPTIRYAFIFVIAIYLFPRYRSFFQSKYMSVNVGVILLSLSTIISSYINEDLISTRNSFLSSILFFTALLETFFLFEYTVEIGQIKKAINVFYTLTVLVVTVTDVLALRIGTVDNVYLIGSKFQVVYLHMFLIALYLMKAKINEENRFKYQIMTTVYFGLSVFMGIVVDCNTGILGTIGLIFIYILAMNRKDLLCSQTIYLIVLVISFMFMFTYEFILNNTYVQNFIVNILNRSLTLTGRTDIYLLLPSVMMKRKWFGYGYGTSYDISVRYFRYADTQNGLAEWIIQVGIIGVAFIILVLFNIFRKLKKENLAGQCNYSIMAYIYTLTILGTVEITFGRLLFGAAALLYASTFMDTTEVQLIEKADEGGSYEGY